MSNYLERKQYNEPVTGKDWNRLVGALTNQRSGGVPIMSSSLLGGNYMLADATHKAFWKFLIPSNVDTIISVKISFSLQAFLSGTGSTSAGGNTGAGTSHNHAITGPSGAGSAHSHTENTAAAYTQNATTATEATHTHTVGSLANAAEATHTHAIPAGVISTPNAVFAGGIPVNAHLFIDSVDVTTPLGGPWGAGPSTDVPEVDITPYITTTGYHKIEISSPTGLGGIICQIQVNTLLNGAI